LTIGSYSKALLPSNVWGKERATTDYAVQKFLYFPFKANISNTAAVAGDSDDFDVVAGDAS